MAAQYDAATTQLPCQFLDVVGSLFEAVKAEIGGCVLELFSTIVPALLQPEQYRSAETHEI